MVAVVVSRLVRVVVRGRGGAYLLLEAGQRDAVDADVAVHPDVALEGLAVTLQHQVRHPRVGPEVAGVAHLDPGVLCRETPALLADALFEDAGEEEVGEDGDAPEAEPPAPVQRLRDARGGEAHEGGLDERVGAALEEEAGHLREVAVRVRVRGATADDEDRRLFSLGLRYHGTDALVHEGEELGADAQGAAVVETEVGVGQPLAHQGCRDVVLGVARRQEHQGGGGDLARPLPSEAVHALGDGGPGELDETALDGDRGSLAYEGDELVELARTAGVAAAVADDQEGGVAIPSAVRCGWRVCQISPPRSTAGRSAPPRRRRTRPWVRG